MLPVALAKSTLHEFGRDGHAELCVPESDLAPLLLPYDSESRDLVVGSGHTPGFGARFEAQWVKQTIGDFGIKPDSEAPQRFNDLYVSVSFLGLDDKNRLGSAMRARDIDDIWYAKGRCTLPAVAKVAGTGFFKVQCSSNDNYASIWNRAPTPTSLPNPNELVVATCNFDTPAVGPYSGKSFRTCSRVTKLDGFLVDFHIQEENLPLIQQVDEMVRKKIGEWRANCHLAVPLTHSLDATSTDPSAGIPLYVRRSSYDIDGRSFPTSAALEAFLRDRHPA
jgi:hypothetical protein